ncbi:hypothetical protein ACFX1X_020897 [Malus domestica]
MDTTVENGFEAQFQIGNENKLHASGKFGNTSLSEETSSSSQSHKKSTANPDITSNSPLIFDDPEIAEKWRRRKSRRRE